MALLQKGREKPSVRFWVLAAFLVLVFLTGGASRVDVQSLAILRPAAALMAGYGLWTIERRHLRDNKLLFAIVIAMASLLVLQSIPLPPAIWQTLPGRSILVDIGNIAQLGDTWRPISLTPSLTANAFFALLVPIAVLLSAVQLSNEDVRRLLPVILAIGFASGLLGILQVVGSDRGPLYLYRVSAFGSSVGLFSNRNHQALLLASLFPMLAIYASAKVASVEAARIRMGIAVVGGLILIPLILVTGSRAGLIIGLIGMISILILYRRPDIGRSPRRGFQWNRLLYAGGAVAALGLALVTVLLSRAEALDRILAGDSLDDLRFQIWGPIATMAMQYLPVGSGAGSFVETYQIAEPRALLMTRYVNQAHNDWLDVLLSSGLAGAAILLAAVLAWAVASYRVWFRSDSKADRVQYAKLGSLVLLMLGLASLTEYPLRAPSLAAVAVLAAIWLGRASMGHSNEIAETAKIDGSPQDYPLAQHR